MKVLTFVTTMLFILNSAQAARGGWDSGGGDVCVFPDGRVELFDIVEAEMEFERRTGLPFQINLGADTLSVMDKVRWGLSRLQDIHPRRYSKYLEWAESFLQEADIRSGIQLIDNPDSGGAVPVGCQFEQIAVQRANLPFPGDARYLINKDLWDRMTSDHKAALIMHEIVMREAKFIRMHGRSNLIRYFNSTLIDGKMFNDIGFYEYSQLIDLVQLVEVETPFGVPLERPRFNSDGSLIGASLELFSMGEYRRKFNFQANFLGQDVNAMVDGWSTSVKGVGEYKIMPYAFGILDEDIVFNLQSRLGIDLKVGIATVAGAEGTSTYIKASSKELVQDQDNFQLKVVDDEWDSLEKYVFVRYQDESGQHELKCDRMFDLHRYPDREEAFDGLTLWCQCKFGPEKIQRGLPFESFSCEGIEN